MHVHTKRYSRCSQMEPERLIAQAVRMGLDGVVITEHHRQWTQEELKALVEASEAPYFLLLSGCEYTSSHGDILLYGMPDEAISAMQPGWSPAQVFERVTACEAAAVWAHPTRSPASYDGVMTSLPWCGIEVASANMQDNERRLAVRLAEAIKVPPVIASDAHQIRDLGRFATEFLEPIQSIKDLRDALRRGRFQLSAAIQRR